MLKRNLERDKLLEIGESVRTGSTDSILSNLFQQILGVCGVDTMVFNRLMNEYLNDVRNNIPQNVKEKSSARGNLRKALLRQTMTWKVFCQGLRFLKFKKFTITISLYHANGKITHHAQHIQIGDLNLNDDVEGPTKIPD